VSIPFVTESTLDLPVYFRTIESAMILPQSSQKRQLLAISAATCAECGLLAYATDYFAMATLLGVSSSGVLSWCSASSKIDDPRLARYIAARTLFAWALILITTTTVLPYLRRPHLLHGVAGASRIARRVYADHGTEKSGEPRSDIKGPSSTDTRDAHSGIVLWPKKQIHTKLVAPSPMSWKQNFMSNRHSNPLVIPFDGVYWFFREPDVQPPEKSWQGEGSPEMFDIHSTDWRSLSMEAHQNLGTSIGLDCCGRIQVAIRNADRYPTSISLEVVLVDTIGKASESLGRVDIVFSRRWTPDDRAQPSSETLNFLVPPHSTIHRFDEVTVVFRLDGFRARAAAKIGIDHFTLVPRGL
jgi:hypothetical protein